MSDRLIWLDGRGELSLGLEIVEMVELNKGIRVLCLGTGTERLERKQNFTDLRVLSFEVHCIALRLQQCGHAVSTTTGRKRAFDIWVGTVAGALETGCVCVDTGHGQAKP